MTVLKRAQEAAIFWATTPNRKALTAEERVPMLFRRKRLPLNRDAARDTVPVQRGANVPEGSLGSKLRTVVKAKGVCS